MEPNSNEKLEKVKERRKIELTTALRVTEFINIFPFVLQTS